MKQKLAILATLCCFLLLSGCKKGGTSSGTDTGGSSTPTLLGRWQVVKDSIVVNNFAFSSGLIPIPGVYIGSSNDYYDFQSDGNVTIYEGGPVGSSPYQLLPGNQLLITRFDWGNVTLTTFTSTNLTWEKAITSSNGGTYYRKAYLKR